MSYVNIVTQIKVKDQNHKSENNYEMSTFSLHFFQPIYTANVYTQTTDLLLFSDVVITHENV